MMMLRKVLGPLSSKLLTPIVYGVMQPSRPSSVPTQSDIMLPYSINYLHDNPGSHRKAKILGRGRASGKGYIQI